MLGLQSEVDDHDRVLLDDTDQQDDADHPQHLQILTAEHQRQQCAESGRRQGRNDRQRVKRVLVQHAQHDIDAEDRRQNQPGLRLQRIRSAWTVPWKLPETVSGMATAGDAWLITETASL